MRSGREKNGPRLTGGKATMAWSTNWEDRPAGIDGCKSMVSEKTHGLRTRVQADWVFEERDWARFWHFHGCRHGIEDGDCHFRLLRGFTVRDFKTLFFNYRGEKRVIWVRRIELVGGVKSLPLRDHLDRLLKNPHSLCDSNPFLEIQNPNSNFQELKPQFEILETLS